VSDEQAQQPVTPRPVPMEINVEPVVTSRGNMVLVRIATWVGQAVYLFSPQEARALAAQIAAGAVQTASGLIIPNGVIPPAQDPKEN